MPYPNIFEREVSDGIIGRLHTLTPESQELWGKMSVDQMLAHCNVAYECIYEPSKHPKPKFPMSFVLKYIVAPFVVGEKPPKKNSPTGPQFIISDARACSTSEPKRSPTPIRFRGVLSSAGHGRNDRFSLR